MDKIAELTSHSLMGVSGPNSDYVDFTEYISKNLKLYELSNDGLKLSTKGQAHYARNELAYALRNGPYQVNVLLAGYDEEKEGSDGKKTEGGPSLYYMDYLAALQKVKYGGHGYAAYFSLGIMDKEYNHEGMSEQDAIDIIKKCIFELHTRFLINQPNFIIKVVDKNGIRVVEHGADPKDT